MTFPILGGGQLDTGNYQIDNSLRFNDGDGAYLSRTPSTTSNRKKFTLSGWFKRGQLDSQDVLFAATSNETNSPEAAEFILRFDADELNGTDYSGGYNFRWTTTALYRDVSAWYHVVYRIDTAAASQSDRVRLYVNGVLQTLSFQNSPPQNFDTQWNVASRIAKIGRLSGYSTQYYDGYVAEVNHVDGQSLDPTSFGEFDEDSGIWKPKAYEGTYGTNGFYLDFENSGSLGADQSGNGNDFTPTNLASTDQMLDTPTNNFATINALQKTSGSQLLSEGNLEHRTTGNWMYLPATFGASSGKWYAEIKLTDASNFNVGVMQLGGASDTTSLMNTNNTILGSNSAGDAWALYGSTIETGTYKNNSTPNYGNISTGFVGNWSNNDIAMIALDTDNQKIWFGRNGSWDNSGDPAAGTNPMPVNTSMIAGETYTFASGPEQATQQWNFGSPPYTISSGNSDQNGYGNFEYAPPSGYLALCTQNLATELSPTIDDGSQYFHTQLYTGTGVARSVTNDANAGDFQPDWLWIKVRDNPNNHRLFDTSRGEGVNGYYDLISNATSAEEDGGRVTAISSNGFTVSSNSEVNRNTSPIVSWQWKASGGSTSSNTDGSITSTVQANTTAGFSIVTYTGTGANATIGHGLGKVPAMIITKTRDNADNWGVYHQGVDSTAPEDYYLPLNLTNARIDVSSTWNDTAPTSSVFSVGSNGVSNDTGGMVAYCFAEIEGYSKFGSFTGNGSTDGSFCYLGFRPQYIVIKNINSTGGWICYDIARNPFNVSDDTHQLQDSEAEYVNGSNRAIDILSNGFKIRHTDTYAGGGSGVNYIYMAFAKSPFVSSAGVPVTAR